MHAIVLQAINKAKIYVFNQVRFVHPTAARGFKYDSDLMEVGAEWITDEAAGAMLAGKRILSNRNLIKLVATMGLEDLYDDDAWVDGIADYIIKHRNDCRALWDHIEALGKQNS